MPTKISSSEMKFEFTYVLHLSLSRSTIHLKEDPSNPLKLMYTVQSVFEKLRFNEN